MPTHQMSGRADAGSVAAVLARFLAQAQAADADLHHRHQFACDSVVPEAIKSYTVITGQVAQAAKLMKLSNTLPPMGNTLVSNVPGPKQTLYLKGATVEEPHPISTLPPSNLLNITLFSYAGQLFFCLIATNELPQLPRLADYIQLAFTELEDAVREAHAP
jgi:diacylglycerol O-acyltransferase